MGRRDDWRLGYVGAGVNGHDEGRDMKQQLLHRTIVCCIAVVFSFLIGGMAAYAQPTTPGGPFSLVYSPDGTKVVASGRRMLRVWNAIDGSPLLDFTEMSTVWVHDVTWSPDSTRIATVSSDQFARIWNFSAPGYAPGELLFEFQPFTEGIDVNTSIDWNPGGQTLAIGGISESGSLIILDTSTYEIVNLFSVGWIEKLSWHPDPEENKILIAGSNGGPIIASIPTTQPVSIVPLGTKNTPSEALAWSLDGSKVAVGYRDGQIYVWDSATNEQLAVMLGTDQNAIRQLVWSPDGTRIAAADWAVRVWNSNTGELITTLDGNSLAVDISPDGTKLVYSAGPEAIQIVDVPQATPVGDVISVACNSDETLLTIAGVFAGNLSIHTCDTVVKETLNFYVTSQGQPTQEGLGPIEVSSVAFNLRGDRLAVASGPLTCSEEDLAPYVVRILDAETQEATQILAGHRCIANTVAWNVDGSRLVSSGEDGLAFVWDAVSGEVLASPENASSGRPRRGATWDPSGQLVADYTVSSPNVNIWDGTTGAIVSILEADFDVGALAWSPDGTQLAYGGENGTVEIVDVPQATQVGDVIAVSWSPDGSMIAGAGQSGILRIWDAATGALIQEFQGITGGVNSVAWSPNSTRVASGGFDTIVRVWDVSTGQLLAALTGHDGSVKVVAWSPDGSQIASASFSPSSVEDSLRVWDGNTYQLIGHRNAGLITDMAWNPLGNEVATASFNQFLSIRPITSAGTIETSRVAVEGDAPRWSVAWNSDGSLLATGDETGKIEILDTSTGNQTAVLVGHTDLVNALAWRPGDTKLASASEDNTILVWDTSTGQVVNTIPIEKEAFTTSIAWSPDGTQLAYGGENGTVEIVDVPLPD